MRSPERHISFCKYEDLIARTHVTYGGLAWFRYFREFRQKAAEEPDLPWDKTDEELWLEV